MSNIIAIVIDKDTYLDLCDQFYSLEDYKRVLKADKIDFINI